MTIFHELKIGESAFADYVGAAVFPNTFNKLLLDILYFQYDTYYAIFYYMNVFNFYFCFQIF